MKPDYTQATAEEPEFWNTEQLARHLNVSTKAIVKWRSQRRLPGACRVGRIWRYRRKEIEKKLLSGSLLLPATK